MARFKAKFKVGDRVRVSEKSKYKYYWLTSFDGVITDICREEEGRWPNIRNRNYYVVRFSNIATSVVRFRSDEISKITDVALLNIEEMI